MAKILLIEDNKEILDSNRVMLELEGYDVITAETFTAGKRLAFSAAPDLIILDIMLPDGNGLDLCRELKETRDINIIFLSALGTKKDVIDGLRAGGFDYIAKPYIMEELLLRVKNILKITTPVSVNDFSFGSVYFKPHSNVAECDGKDLLLKNKEYAILDLLCRNPGRYISTEQILTEVWNYNDGSLQPLYNSLSSLREKISGTGISIAFKRGAGYMAVQEKQD